MQDTQIYKTPPSFAATDPHENCIMPQKNSIMQSANPIIEF